MAVIIEGAAYGLFDVNGKYSHFRTNATPKGLRAADFPRLTTGRAAAMVARMLGWIVVVASMGLGFRRFFLGYPARPSGARTLAAREIHTVRLAGRTIYPEGGAIAASADRAGLALHADRFVGAQTARNRILMRLLLVAIEHATLVFPAPGPRGWRRFTALEPDQQLAYLDAWRYSELPARRLVFVSLRAILTMGYFASPEVLRSLGLAPREIRRVVTEADLLWPAVGEHPQSIPFTRADVTPPGDARTPLGPTGAIHPDYR